MIPDAFRRSLREEKVQEVEHVGVWVTRFPLKVPGDRQYSIKPNGSY